MKPFSLLCFLWVSAAFVQAQDKTRIIALENSWNQAELHNDAHAVDLLLADAYVMTVADGYTLNKAAMLASVRDTSYRPDVLQSDNMEVHMYGNTAIVGGSYLEKGKDKRKTLRAAGTLQGCVDQSGGGVALRRQSFQRETVSFATTASVFSRTTVNTYPTLQEAGILVGTLARNLTQGEKKKWLL